MNNSKSGNADNSSSQQKKPGNLISDLILGSLKSRSGKDTTKWLANLTQDTMQEVEEAVDPSIVTQLEPAITDKSQQAERQHQIMIRWVDRIFDLFQQYEFEFNKAVAGTDLSVSCERPALVNETVSGIRLSDLEPTTITWFKGRLSTRLWTLLMRGHKNKIEGFILPVNKLFAFSGSQDGFPRFLLMEPSWKEDELYWDIDGEPISFEQLPGIAKQFFGALIQVARGEATTDEVFSLRPKPKAKRSYDTTSLPPPVDCSNITEFKTTEPLKKELAQSPHDLQTPSAGLSYPEQKFAHKVDNEANTMSNNNANTTFANACDLMTKAIETELEHLGYAGARAFEAQDMAKVEKTLKRTAKIKNMQDQVNLLIRQWKDALKDD